MFARIESGTFMAQMDSALHSFEQIYEEYKVPIYNYIFRLVGNREQANDLTQDTFLKVFRALPKMDADLRLSSWLYRIATNTCYDALRRRKLLSWLPWEHLEQELIDPITSSLEENSAHSAQIRGALQRMLPQQRAALLLYVHEGLSYAEIAQVLAISEGGVKMYISRARQSFRQHFKALEEEGAE